MYDHTTIRLYNHTTVQRYDHSTIQGATFNMRGQLYQGMLTPQLCSVVQWSVHWALSQTTWVLVLAGTSCCALETCRKKKMQVPLLGLVKSICYLNQLNVNLLKNKLNTISVCTRTCKGTTWMDILTNVSKDRIFSNQVRS